MIVTQGVDDVTDDVTDGIDDVTDDVTDGVDNAADDLTDENGAKKEGEPYEKIQIREIQQEMPMTL